MKLHTAVLLLLCSYSCFASGRFSGTGAGTYGAGGCYSVKQGPFSLYNNPAGLAGVSSWWFSGNFHYPFGLKSLTTTSAGVVFPAFSGAGGLSAERFGSKLYNIHKISAAYAHDAGRASLGVRVSYLQELLQEVNTYSTFIAEIGGIFRFSETLRIGGHIYNFNNAGLNKEPVPITVTAGISWQPADVFIITAESSKESDMPPVFRTGAEYKIFDILFVRTGISTNPFTEHFGAGIIWKGFCFDYAFTHHKDLGFTHSLSLAFSLKNRQDDT